MSRFNGKVASYHRMHSRKEYQTKVATLFETEAVPHFLVIKRLALYLVRNQAAADDLVQETYVQALKLFGREFKSRRPDQ